MQTSNRSPLLQTLFAKGKPLKSSDEKQDIILIKEGFIKRYMISKDGTLSTQIVYGYKDIFPLTLAYRILLGQSLYGGPEVYHYSAMTDCSVYTLSSEEFTDALRKNPKLYKDLFSEAGYHLSTTIIRIENMAMGNSYSRVAHIILFYGQRFGIKKPNGIQVSVPLTHQDIADIINVTRETVTRAMLKLRNNNLVKTTNKEIIITDIDRLSKEAYIL